MTILFNLLGGIFGTVLCIASLFLYDYIKQWYTFNNGMCRKAKEPWIYDYTHHDGYRVYITADNKNMCMISFKIIDKKWLKFNEL